jgi:hypothetical protein
LPEKPDSSRVAPQARIATFQADAVRADQTGLQVVTEAWDGHGDRVTPDPDLPVDNSTGRHSHESTRGAPASRSRSRLGRAAPNAARGASGLVIKRISAQSCPPATVRLEIGQRDVRIHRVLKLQNPGSRRGGGRRREICEFTGASARRLTFTARNFPGLAVMVTLTYPRDFPTNGRTVMDHWRRMRQWFVRQGHKSGLWFKEFQSRGAPHFHVFLTGAIPHEAVAEAWYRIVASGDIRHLWAGTRVEPLRNPSAAGTYAAKYASKTRQKDVPEEFSAVGRFWGVWGKPDIARVEVLRGSAAVSAVRTVRRSYKNRRKAWRCRRRFRDNGRAGFTAWESGPLAEAILNVLTRISTQGILDSEHQFNTQIGKGRGANTYLPPPVISSKVARQQSTQAPDKRNQIDVGCSFGK